MVVVLYGKARCFLDNQDLAYQQAVDDLIKTALDDPWNGLWTALMLVEYGASKDVKRLLLEKMLDSQYFTLYDHHLKGLVGRALTRDEADRYLLRLLEKKPSVSELLEFEKAHLGRSLTPQELEAGLLNSLTSGEHSWQITDALGRLGRSLARTEIDLFIRSFKEKYKDEGSNGSGWGEDQIEIAKLPAGASPEVLRELVTFFLGWLEIELAEEAAALLKEPLQSSELELAISKAIEQGSERVAFEIATKAGRKLTLDEIAKLKSMMEAENAKAKQAWQEHQEEEKK